MSFFSCCDCREGERMRASTNLTGHTCMHAARFYVILFPALSRFFFGLCLWCGRFWSLTPHTLSQWEQQGNRRHCAALASTFAPTAPAPFSSPRLLKEVDIIFLCVAGLMCVRFMQTRACTRRARARTQCAPHAAPAHAPQTHPPNLDGGCPRCLQDRRIRQAASWRGMCYMRWTTRLCCGAH
jgi:hypothetical protein